MPNNESTCEAVETLLTTQPKILMYNVFDQQLEELDETYSRVFKNAFSLAEKKLAFDTLNEDLQLHTELFKTAKAVGLLDSRHSLLLSMKTLNLYVTYIPNVQAC